MPNPSPLVLLAKRISETLNDTRIPGGSSLEPEWSPVLVQRVLGAASEVILDAVAHGEEVQLGRVGLFYPKVVEAKTVVSNLNGGKEIDVPRRIKLGFDATTQAEQKIQSLNLFLDSLAATSNGKK